MRRWSEIKRRRRRERDGLLRAVDSAGRLWEMDLATGCQYVHLNGLVAPDGTIIRTVELAPGVNADYNAVGTLMGIEFI